MALSFFTIATSFVFALREKFTPMSLKDLDFEKLSPFILFNAIFTGEDNNFLIDEFSSAQGIHK